jgi:hypothetical protein
MNFVKEIAATQEPHVPQVATSQRMHRALKVGAQGFDEVRIRTVPRWKESELSGDEWRYHAEIEFYRKGELVHSAGTRDVEAACAQIGYHHANGLDNGKGFFAGERNICDQEGCSEPATTALKLKKGYNRDGSERKLWDAGEYRCFCDRHKHRGDCSLEDADCNYEVIPMPEQP